jgi:hypothetical protein
VYSSKTKKMTKKRKLITIAVIMLSTLVALILLEKSGVTDFYQKPKSETPAVAENTINYDPPTQDEVKAGDIQKDIITNEPAKEPAVEASVVIVDAGQYDEDIEVRAFVSNVIKDGECTYIFTSDTGTTLEKKTLAYADASTTPCITLKLQRSEFSSGGTWNVKVKYTDTGSTITGNTSKNLEIL